MVREYSDRPLDEQAVERILASAFRAPSAGFSQGWAFLVLSDAVDRSRFWRFVPTRVENTPEIQKAPLIVVPMANRDAYLERYAEPDKGWQDRAEARWPAPYWFIDTGMASLLMLLSAVDEGLDACFFGIQPEHIEPFRAEFGVPHEYSPIGAITIGYRAVDLAPQSDRIAQRRKDARSVLHRGQWDQH
jgi:nitroreductase